MTLRYRLVDLLCDGHFRSGEWLGRQLGVTRAAVWKHVRALSELGLDVHAVHGRGYRLSQPFQPLCAETVRALLSPEALARIASLEVFQVIDSTSDHLKRTACREAADGARICMAEWQSAGRGRRGRRWVSPYGASLYLSVACQLSAATLQGGGLSPVVAISVLRALRSCGVAGVGLKWPNDVLYEGRKLAGILLDVSGESAGPFWVVIGIGVNVRLPDSAGQSIDQPWADVAQCGVTVERNRLAGLIVEALLQCLDAFSHEGLAAFAEEWARHDLLAGQPAELLHDDGRKTCGVVRGIDSQGALLLEQGDVTRRFHAGEVSIRLAQ